MKISIFIVDAFTTKIFGGNPAGVCPLNNWIDDSLLQNIAMENNLSETAFFVQKDEVNFELRWFTPVVEVDLCGHATLASAFVIFNYLNYKNDKIIFHTKSGELKIHKKENLLAMDFPAWKPKPISATNVLIEAFNIKPKETLTTRDLLVVFENENEIVSLNPDFEKLKQIDCLGIIATAKGSSADFVSRFFAPKAGINEDPVTGSAHSTLIPFWAERLNKDNLYALQLSKRQGEIFCEYLGDRVLISGNAVLYSKGEIYC